MILNIITVLFLQTLDLWSPVISWSFAWYGLIRIWEMKTTCLQAFTDSARDINQRFSKDVMNTTLQCTMNLLPCLFCIYIPIYWGSIWQCYVPTLTSYNRVTLQPAHTQYKDHSRHRLMPNMPLDVVPVLCARDLWFPLISWSFVWWGICHRPKRNIKK